MSYIKYYFSILFLLTGLPELMAQDTISLSKLEYRDNLYYYGDLPYSGVAGVSGPEFNEYYKYCTGEICGYMAFYPSGDTAGVHTYRGNDINLVFYNTKKIKTLEYNQRILDHTYTYGEWIDYRDDGTIQVKGNYKLVSDNTVGRGGEMIKWKSVRDGNWEYYNEKGEKIKTEVWRSDKLIRTKE